MSRHLQVEEQEFEKWVILEQEQSAQKIEQLIPELHRGKPLSQSKIGDILGRVRTLQEQRGYRGNYDSWIKEHLPVRLESLLAGSAG